MKILSGAAATGAGHAFAVQRDERTHIPVTVDGTGTFSVDIEGKVEADLAWQKLATAITANGAQDVVRLPYMRANITSGTGTYSVTVALDARGLDVSATVS